MNGFQQGPALWYVSGDEGGVEVAPELDIAFFQRYPAMWSGQVGLGHLFRPPVARWSGRLNAGGLNQPGGGDVVPNPTPQPVPDESLSKIGDDV